MAEKLDSFPPRRTRAASKYAKFLDGSIWKLTRGKDFIGTVESAKSALYAMAKTKALKVRVAKLSDTQLVVQSFPPDPQA